MGIKIIESIKNEVVISKVARELKFNRQLVKAIVKHRDRQTEKLIKSREYKEIYWKFFGYIKLKAQHGHTAFDKLKKMITAKKVREEKAAEEKAKNWKS